MSHQIEQETKICGGKDDESVKDFGLDKEAHGNGDGKEGTAEETECEEGPPSFEKVLECLDMPGRYQLTQLAFAKMTIITPGFILLAIVFVGYTPYYECRKVNETELINKYYPSELGGNSTIAHVHYESCDIKLTISSNQSSALKEEITNMTTHYLSCPNGRDFFSAKDTTYTSEWDLVCDSKGQVEFTLTTLTVGQVIGGLVSSSLADRFGRKPVIAIASCLCCLLEVAIVLSPNIIAIYIIRLFSGLALQTLVTCANIFAIELAIPKHRQIVSIANYVAWDAIVFMIGGVAYLVQDKSWRYFHGVSIGFGLVGFLIPFFLKESPRWLVANKRYEEALEILKMACRQNGNDFENIKNKFNVFIDYEQSSTGSTVKPLITKNSINNSSEDNDGSLTTGIIIPTHNTPEKSDHIEALSTGMSSSLSSFLCNRRTIILLSVVSYLWLTNVLTYYGLFITSSVLAGDRFLNFILMGFVELPSLGLVLYMLNKMGRRIVFGIFMGLTGLCLMVSALMSTVGNHLSGADTVTTIMFILGKFAITSSFAALYVLTPELFPTNLRSTGVGFCSGVGRIGSAVAPFMRVLHDEVKWGPALLFTTMSFMAVLVGLYLPETKDKDLPTTLEDLQSLKRTVGDKRDEGIDEVA